MVGFTAKKIWGTTLGLRSNNPGNIRAISGVKWQGQTGANEKGFVIFDTAENGIRALSKVLKNYYTKHGLTDVKGIINRWAPPVENDTNSYVNSVAAKLKVSPTSKLILNVATFKSLASAIILHENGVNPYPDTLIKSSVEKGLA